METIVLPLAVVHTAERPTTKQLKRFRRLCRTGDHPLPTASSHTLRVLVGGVTMTADLFSPSGRLIARLAVGPGAATVIEYVTPTAWERRWVPETLSRLAWSWVLHPARAAAV